jgi:hypothetical protein
MDADDPNQIECPRCGAKVSMSWSRCPECGRSFYPEEEPPVEPERRSSGSLSAFSGWLARSLITFMVIGGLLGAFTGMALGSNWLVWMLAGLVLFWLGWSIWGWIHRRGQ